MGKYFHGICDSSVAGAIPGCVSNIGSSACLATTPASLGTVLCCLLGDMVVTSLVFLRQVARLGNARADTGTGPALVFCNNSILGLWPSAGQKGLGLAP